MRKGFLYLGTIMDWFTRKVLAWQMSNIERWSARGARTMARGSRLLHRGTKAIHKFGAPQIMNWAQGRSSHPSAYPTG